MTTRGRGNQWQRPGFSVFMNTNDDIEPERCLSCRRWKGKKHKVCHYDNKGYISINKKHGRL